MAGQIINSALKNRQRKGKQKKNTLKEIASLLAKVFDDEQKWGNEIVYSKQQKKKKKVKAKHLANENIPTKKQQQRNGF